MTKPETFSYTRNPQVEQIVSDAVAGIAADIAAAPGIAGGVKAVILGGGYGRGEGGATPDGKPYNDLDFFVISSLPEAAGFFHGLSEKWEKILGIDVDFFLVPDLRALYANADTLMIQELLAGYRIIYGDMEIFAAAPVMPLERLPWREGARLLLNRGTGLLLSRGKLAAGAEPEFICRNIHKAALGCGDALLIANHRYRRHGMERLQELRRMFPGELAELYDKALHYKYSPQPDAPKSMDALRPQWNAMLKLYLETVTRFAETVCGRGFASPFAAAQGLARAGTESPGNIWKNILLSIRYLSKSPSILCPLREHPRIKLTALLVKCLESPSDTKTEAEFLNLWKRFN